MRDWECSEKWFYNQLHCDWRLEKDKEKKAILFSNILLTPIEKKKGLVGQGPDRN